jgi:signal transduction histidine kinase
MFNKFSVLAFFLFVFVTFAIGQNAHIDSLYRAEQSITDDIVRVKHIHKIVAATWHHSLEKGYEQALRGYELAQKTNDPECLMIMLTDVGLYHYFGGDYPEASHYFRQALRASNGQNFGEYPAYTYTRLGNLNRVQGQFDSAQYYYDKTLESIKGGKSRIAEASVYFHMGWLQYDLSAYDKALPLLFRSLAIRRTIEDSLTIAEGLRVIGMVHLGKNAFDSASYYLNRAHGIGIRHNDVELVMFSKINIADLHFATGNLLESINQYQKALELLQTHDFKRYRALVFHHIGVVFDSQGDYLKSIEYLLNALKLSEELNSRQEVIKINVGIGWAYNNLKNYDQALAFGNKAMKLAGKLNDAATVSFAQNLVGNIYFNTKQYDKALRYYDSALVNRNKLGLTLLEANTMYNIAMVYEAQGRHDEALQYLFRDLDVTEKAQNVRGQVFANNAIGLIYGKMGNLRKAEEHINLALRLSRQLGAQIYRRESYSYFAQIYTLNGKYQKANLYYRKYIEVDDSIVNRESQVSSLQMNALYELDKKERELETLANENALKQSRIDVQQTELQLKNFVLFISIGGVLLLGLGGIILYRYYREKSASHKTLERLNREVSEKNEEIQAQSEELVESNSTLNKLNYDLLEKQEEIEAQSEELREANETISEINRGLESVINKRTQQLKEAYKELDTFFYRSSHDFRRPLTTFLGLAEVAKVTVKDTNALELFEKVKETATNLDKMLFKLQSISDLGSQQLVYKEIFFKEIFNGIYDSFRDEIMRGSMKISCDVELLDPFYSYPAMIRIIIENLLENTIHFRRKEGSRVTLKIYQQDRHVVIEVADNGQGIDSQYFGQIFDMYFRGNERSKGNGLGLYIVKKAVEKLNGSVTVTSEMGEGSVFNVFLPIEKRI